MKKYFLSLSIFSGTIIGVGLFGLPYVTMKVGFFPILIYFALLGLLILTIQLLFGEVCLRTVEKHRMPGYVKLYLGKKTSYLTLATNTVSLYGATLAYIIVGGGFLANLLMPIFGGDTVTYSLIFFFAGAIIIYLGSKTIANSEFFSLLLFFGVLLFLLFKGLPYIKTEHFFTFDYKNLFLPYGVILFSLWGTAVIPEAREILGDKGKLLKSVIIVGILIPIITYLGFIFLVLGASGGETSEDALTGLKAMLGERILVVGYLFGIITTFTSFLTLGLTLKKIFWYDVKMTHFTSWALACFAPLVLYLAGLKNFIQIIAFTGAVTLGIDGILVFLTYLKAKEKGQRIPEYKINLPKKVIYVLIALFMMGVVLELVSL